MPRKKRKITGGEDTFDEVDVQIDVTPLKHNPTRKTRSQTSNQIKVNELKKKGKKDLQPEPDLSTKKAKVVLTKIKIKDESHISDIEHSPESVDSGIVSGLSFKDESYTQNDIEMKTEKNSVKLKESLVQLHPLNQSESNCNHLETGDNISNSENQSAPRKRKSKINSEDTLKKELKSKTAAKKSNKSNVSSKSKNPSSNGINLDACESSSKDESVLQVLTRLEFISQPKDEIQVSTKPENGDSTSDSDWEDVEEQKEQNLEEYNPVIPKDGVEITIDCPELNNKRKRKKAQFDHMEYIRLYINRERKEHQLNTHKTHLLCLLSHGLYVNNILNSLISKVKPLCEIPTDIETLTAARNMNKVDSEGIKKIVDWFRNKFTFENNQTPFLNISENMYKYLKENNCLNGSEYNLVLVIIARALGFNVRFCVSLYPVTYKAHNLLKKPSSKKQKTKKLDTTSTVDDPVDINEGPSTSAPVEEKNSISSTSKSKKKKPVKTSKRSNSKKSRKNKDLTSTDESDIDDEDFILESKKRSKKSYNKTSKRQSKDNQTEKQNSSRRQSNRKILSSDSDPGSPINDNLPLEKVVCWLEIFSKKEKQWISIECASGTFNDPFEIERLLPQPVTYILAFDNKSFVKDLTRRYCTEYMTSTLKMRIDPDWWEESLDPFSPPKTKLDKEEEKKLDEMLINKPLPKTIAEYKNHPLYALKRHLLKFEAIYPPDAAPVGFFRKEPVYARECVCQLHSRETWLKEARVVRIGEEPYKIVKARPKWDRIAGVLRTDLPLDIFGFWQTQPYEPPTAVGGKVPRNEYGNVELFKPCMLPKGTVHLQIPGLNRVAKKLGIDCSPAVVGFDGHKGSIHPVFDGFVVCKEYKNTLLEAWDEDQENARKREEEKREKRIYGNWKKLIRGLLIREKIKLKYHSN